MKLDITKLTRPAERTKATLIAITLHQRKLEREYVARVIAMNDATIRFMKHVPPPTISEAHQVGKQWIKAMRDGEALVKKHNIDITKAAKPT